MTRRAALAALGAAALSMATIAVTAQQGRQTFRATGALVTVEVGVRSGARMVQGLTAGDFEVDDNGVRQRVEMLDVESLPIDLTLVVDTSGSVAAVSEEIGVYVRDSAAILRADDRVRVITFAGDVVDTIGLQPSTEPVEIRRGAAGGATALYDAIAAGLMRTRREDRRQLLVVFTDGIDTHSWTDLDALRIVAERSDTVLHVFLVKDVMNRPVALIPLSTRRPWLSGFDYDTFKLGHAARTTGGWLEDVAARPQLPGHLRKTLDDFRTSYVLRYRPTGVAQEGWHSIAVRVPSGGYAVRARTGYFWGALPK